MSLDVYLYVNVDTGGAAPQRIFLYEANITHNLNEMAAAALMYIEIWRPEEIKAKYAGDIIEALEEGLADMKSNPEEFKKYNPKNGWGTYEVFVPWVENYLNACKENPKALIEVSR